jgi:DNA-binding PadR family transcriptional regulator
MFEENSSEVVQSKLLILYILDKVENPLTNSEVTQFILENNYMNYFMVQQFLSELVNAKFIEFSTKDGNEYYHLSSAGRATLDFFNDRIPEEIKSNVDSSYEQKKKDMIKESQIVANYFKKNESEYIIILKVIEKDIVLFSLSLNVPSKEQAKLICNNWKEKSNDVYKNILDILINE